MARRKRSERQAQPTSVVTIEKPKAERVSTKPTGEYRAAFCPVCGVAHGRKRLEYQTGSYWTGEGAVNYWEWLEERDAERGLDNEEPFGVIQEVGRGKKHSFGFVGYFSPNEDIDGFYPLVKARLLLAIKRWLQNNWISSEELLNIIQNK